MGRVPIALASIVIAKEFIFCSVIANSHCEQTLSVRFPFFIVICSRFWENMIFELQKFNLPCPSGKAWAMLMYLRFGSFLNDWRKTAAAVSGGSVEIFSKLTFKSMYSFLIVPSTASCRKHCQMKQSHSNSIWNSLICTWQHFDEIPIEGSDSVIYTSKSGSELDLFLIPRTFWNTSCSAPSGTSSRENSLPVET